VIEAHKGISKVVRSLWPRARVRVFGSWGMGTPVDGSDLDLVVTLPSVHHSTLTSQPGDLHSSTEDSHDQSGMFGKLKKKLEVAGATDVRVIRGAIGVVKCRWNAGEGEGIEGDISFEASSHYGVR
jgi:hypothetical protein